MVNKMFDKISKKTAAPLLALLFSASLSAATHPFEFHADARMWHDSLGLIDQAYGYMYVVTDEDGNGTVNVMFSNGSGLDLAQFNARVSFLDAAGGVIREEHFDCWLDAAGLREAIECKVTKPLSRAEFDSISVDFYLSEVDEIDAAAVD